MITFDYFNFFDELTKNNSKEWFDIHRKEYENYVKKPFKKLVDEIILEIFKIDSRIQIESKDAIFRINRDIRFSKDKTPYKTHCSAVIAPKGKKDMVNPGIYFELNSSGMIIYGGIYNPNSEELGKIRIYLAENLQEFQSIINEKIFLDYFDGKILGEKSKRIPKELNEAAKIEPLLFNKAFYYTNSYSKKEVLNSGVKELVVSNYLASMPFINFFKGVLK